MQNILIALFIGIVAGILDAVPMLIQKMNFYACLSAFMHWLVLGLIIPFVSWDIDPWLKGLIIGELSAIPVILMIWPNEKKGAIPIVLFSAVLGIGVALAGARFIV